MELLRLKVVICDMMNGVWKQLKSRYRGREITAIEQGTDYIKITFTKEEK